MEADLKAGSAWILKDYWVWFEDAWALCSLPEASFSVRWLHGIGSLLIQLFFTQWGCVEGQNLLIIRLQLTTHLRETNQPFPLWKRERYATLLTIHIQNTSLVSLLMIQESVSLWFKNLKIYQDDKFYFRLHYICELYWSTQLLYDMALPQFAISITTTSQWPFTLNFMNKLWLQSLSWNVWLFEGDFWYYIILYVTMDNKTSFKSHGYICSNSQHYIVWAKMIYFTFMPKIIRMLSKIMFHEDILYISSCKYNFDQ